MGRIHLFEFEDQAWFPNFIRNYGTDFLQFLANKTRMFVPLIPWIEKGLAASKTANIIDLASGGGGGILSLNSELLENNPGVTILLTDFFPNLEAFEYTSSQASNIAFSEISIDARKVPEQMVGLRTQFLSLHHFQPTDAVKILENAVSSNQPIFIAEGQERSIPSFLAMLFSPITVLLTTPFIRPFSFGRLLFTYLIPIVPLFVWWDGMASCLRTYSVEEMNGLISQVNGKEKFDWETGRVKSGPTHLLYLLGIPKN